ncbi:hypothetical protein ACKLNR_001442 [Fusarium oxysporum f. sp. zingiberi]
MPINSSSVSPSSKLNHWTQAMATWPDALARSRFHADRAEYKEAAALLRDFLKTASDRLEPVLELSRVIKTQGYWRDALTVLLDELDNLPGPVGTATTREERLGIQMRIEVCRLKLFVTASFDAPLQEAEELRLQTSDFAALEELEPTTIEIALCYSRMRVLSCLHHQPIAPAELEALISWLRPTYDRLVSASRHRESFEILQAYSAFLESATRVGITTLDFETWSGMMQRFLSSPDLPPLFKANAMVLLADKASERLDEAYLAEIETSAKTIYIDQGHAVGVMDLRFQQVSRALKKDHQYLTDELLDELKGYFAKYQTSDSMASYQTAIHAFFAHIPQWLAFELQMSLSHIRDELAHQAGAVFLTHIGRVGLISMWLAHSGKAASAVEAAEALDTTLREGDCRWLRGIAPYLASQAYSQLHDYRKAHDRAARAVEIFQETFPSDAATARNALLQAKLELYQQNNSDPKDLEEILSFADTETTRDRAAGLTLQAAQKTEMIVVQIRTLQTEQRRYWMERMLTFVNELESDSEDEDIRMAGLFQVQGMELTLPMKETDPKAWEPCLACFDKSVALYMKHLRFVEAANTRQMQSCAIYRWFELSPSAHLLQRCLDLIDISLDLFREADNVTFIATASRWRSIVVYTGWERGWMVGDKTLTALQDAENAWAVERADMTALASFEAVSRRQQFTSLKGLRETYRRAFRVCQIEGRVTELWEWTQKAKARSLSDQLGVDSLVPAELREQVIQDPTRRELMEEADALSPRIAGSPPEVRLRLRGELEAIHKRMAQDTLLKAMMDIKNGTPVGIDQIQQLGSQMKKCSPGRDVKFIDWLEHSNKLWVLVLGGEEKTPTVMQCPVSPDEVAAWKREWLDAQPGEVSAFQEDDFYSEYEPEFSLRALDGLVAPLDQLTKPGDLVVLCPTGVLHSIPLHALYISDNVPVIERNPVIYSASLTTFSQCCRRGGWSEVDSGQRPAASVATQWTLTSVLQESDDRWFDPEEQEDVYSLISNTAATSDAKAVTGTDVTRQFFVEAMQQSALFHFHGHGIFDRSILADQSLELADGNIAVRDIFDLKLKAPHMTLVACDSASQGIAAGDEPLGIVTALLCAGAGSVLGTIWPTASRTGRCFTDEFYTNILEQQKRSIDVSTDVGGHAAIIDLAEVSQRAVLALRRNIDTRHPYHWGAFVLHGCWFMSQRGQHPAD